MAYDFRANQVRLNKIISSGSIPILIYPSSSAADFAGNLAPSFSTASIGTDVFVFVSGSTTAKTVFGGDVVVSGTLNTTNLTVSGSLTGSISGTINNNPFLVAGQNITTTYNSLGQWEVSSSGGGSNLWTELDASTIYTTSSVRVAQLSASLGAIITGSVVQGGVGTALGQDSHAEGYNVVTYGQYAHAEGTSTTALGYGSHAEGNNTVSSGEGSHAEGGSTKTYGAYAHAEGYGSEAYGTGSFASGLYTVASGAVDGTFPLTTTQAAFGKFNLQDNSASLFVVGDGTSESNRHDVFRVNSGSVGVTGSLFVTQTMSASTVSASYMRVNGISLTPTTASLVVYGDNTNLASGSISNLFDDVKFGSIGKYDIDVLAISSSNRIGATWKFSTTCIWPMGGAFSFLAATELSADNIPESAMWDVNFNNSAQLEVTGSSGSVGTFFYVQVTKKMVCNFSGILQ
jgi:hypothetical protein